MSTPFRSVKWPALAVLAILLATQCGCVSSQKLAAGDRGAIHTLYVDPAVVMPDAPSLLTRGEAFSMGLGIGLGGAVGGVIAGSGAGGGTPRQQFLAYLNDNHIALAEMLPAALADVITRRELFELVSSADKADAILRLEVRDYGLGYTANMFSHDYRSTLVVRGTLTEPGGKIVWSKAAIEVAMSADWPAATLNDLFTQPELMRAQMSAASTWAAQELAGDIAGTKR